MKKPLIISTVVAAVALAAMAKESAPSVSATAALKDGSTVKGEFLTKKISGSTIFDKDLPMDPAIVKSVAFTGTNGAAKVELTNGDRFAMTITNDVFALRSLLGELKIPRASFRTISLSPRSASANAGSGDGLVFHCTFNSRDEVATPKLGPNGIFLSGDFAAGVDGLALHIPPYVSAARFELPPETIGRKGTIEFWGKIDVGMAHLSTGGCPRFFALGCYEPRDEISQDWNANNGAGGAGLTFRIGGLPIMASSSYSGNPSYDLIKDDIYGWHHYALVWDVEGITLSSSEKAMAAVFVDGKPVMTTSMANWKGPLLANHRTFLVFPSPAGERMPYGRVGYSIDEFKIWDHAKTDFQECAARRCRN